MAAWWGARGTDAVGMGRTDWPAVSAGAGVGATGALAAGAPSILQRAMSKMPIAQVVAATSNMPTAITGHHREGASRFPPQALQNSSPALSSFPHHLHGRVDNNPLHISFAFSPAICARSPVARSHSTTSERQGQPRQGSIGIFARHRPAHSPLISLTPRVARLCAAKRGSPYISGVESVPSKSIGTKRNSWNRIAYLSDKYEWKTPAFIPIMCRDPKKIKLWAEILRKYPLNGTLIYGIIGQ